MANAKYRAVEVVKANGPLQLVEREVREPRPGEVRIKIHACGVCHSDSFTVVGAFPGIQYPRVPGHEIAGVIDAIGSDVAADWKQGQRVGVGWFGGNCGHCESCRRGDFITCQYLKVPGIHYDGGYAESVIVPATALALMPDDLSDVDAGPLMCAGITTFNALRNSGARAGDLVAVLGIGGLGHLGVQFAAKMGFHTVAIARGKDKEPLARELGAHHYIDSQAEDAAAALQALGGASVVVATVTNAAAMGATLGGLGLRGKLIVVGTSMEPIEVAPAAIIGRLHQIAGHASGSSIDSQDTLAFSALTGVRPMIETMPLERAQEAY